MHPEFVFDGVAAIRSQTFHDRNMRTKPGQPMEMRKTTDSTASRIAVDSHVGLVREINEDSFAYWHHPSEPNVLVVLADGIGGHENGDVASCLCVRTILVAWRNQLCFRWNSVERIARFLRTTVSRSNQLIHGYNVAYSVQHPMGTTLVAGVFMPGKLVVAHAGDSRCYRLRGQHLEAITEDHSIVAELVKRGVIRAEDAQEHPFSHIISRSVGPCPELEVEIRVFDVEEGDRFLFCTDGLNNHVKDPVIREMLENSESAEDSVKRLLYASLKGGGEDNITVASVFPPSQPKE